MFMVTCRSTYDKAKNKYFFGWKEDSNHETPSALALPASHASSRPQGLVKEYVKKLWVYLIMNQRAQYACVKPSMT
jgi:hypothetical protein